MWAGLIGVSRVRCQAQGPGRVMDNPDLVERFPLDQNLLNKKGFQNLCNGSFVFIYKPCNLS